MTKRLQVLLEDDEYKEIKDIARMQRMTLAEWVRQSLRQARKEKGSADAKLRAIAAAAEYNFPTADIDVMLRQMEPWQEAP